MHSDRNLDMKLALQLPTYVRTWNHFNIAYTHAALV
jgi:hypothetical protein